MTIFLQGKRAEALLQACSCVQQRAYACLNSMLLNLPLSRPLCVTCHIPSVFTRQVALIQTVGGGGQRYAPGLHTYIQCCCTSVHVCPSLSYVCVCLSVYQSISACARDVVYADASAHRFWSKLVYAVQCAMTFGMAQELSAGRSLRSTGVTTGLMFPLVSEPETRSQPSLSYSACVLRAIMCSC